MRIRKALIVLGTTAAVAFAANAAYAAWTANGTGSGSAKAVTAKAVTTVDTASPTAQLYPGGNGDLTVQLKNSNPYPVTVTAIDKAATGSIVSGDPTCDASNGVTFTNTAGSWDVAANGTTTVTLAGKVHMSNSSVDACQGLSFTVPVSITAASSATS
ncbi:MAG TPA: hypothetical protein VHL53_16360 [Acidimicrobiia bacterium]|nr:hypothetical protein [Acidimicrobiia bacterium]